MPVMKNHEFLISLGIVVLSLMAIALANTIPPSNDDGVGARFIPLVLSVSMLILGGIGMAYAATINAPKEPEPAQNQASQVSLTGMLFRIGVLTALGFFYLFLMGALGYALSTFVVLVMCLVLFGNKRPIPVILMSLIGTAIYYVVFVKQLGIYDPPGWLIDVSSFL
ncbi:tripartite tricarboxylate transporter TctB family protein [Magnetospira sp. QH-2]|uniref:tripartite tricarboxylate transporter TctB family protein n=1 Tax=Magnetospira sp. (strain QH-2) TaxID=1288970 RepID=UPI0003E81BAB|nr:tripartite tricarboxylate transporter TctB family protein [Magnetospira sp. QH-2]CCQ75241.1 membrane protein of unknown function [Magnetospira sp. QH-2]